MEESRPEIRWKDSGLGTEWDELLPERWHHERKQQVLTSHKSNRADRLMIWLLG